MGDRAMAQIKTNDGSLYFYTHGAGYELPEAAKEAVRLAKPRMGDDSYALKIVIDSLIKASGARDRETGAGIMLGPNAEDEYNGDNPSVIINLSDLSVEVLGSHAPQED
jgi:hypothetical protein